MNEQLFATIMSVLYFDNHYLYHYLSIQFIITVDIASLFLGNVNTPSLQTGCAKGLLGRHIQKPFPSCVVSPIRRPFPEEGGMNKGFEWPHLGDNQYNESQSQAVYYWIQTCYAITIVCIHLNEIP